MNEVLNVWDKFSGNVVNANTAESFKWKLNRYMDEESWWILP